MKNHSSCKMKIILFKGKLEWNRWHFANEPLNFTSWADKSYVPKFCGFATTDGKWKQLLCSDRSFVLCMKLRQEECHVDPTTTTKAKKDYPPKTTKSPYPGSTTKSFNPKPTTKFPHRRPITKPQIGLRTTKTPDDDFGFDPILHKVI